MWITSQNSYHNTYTLKALATTPTGKSICNNTITHTCIQAHMCMDKWVCAHVHTHKIRSLGTDMQRMEAEAEQNKDHKFLGGRKKKFSLPPF